MGHKMTVPTFYPDNVNVIASRTTSVRGNVVSDIYGGTITGIKVTHADTVRAKDNKCIRLKAKTQSTGFEFSNCTDVFPFYNVASRCDRGFYFDSITTLKVYNLTAHNCMQCIVTNVSGEFYNIALSAYPNTRYYVTAVGFTLGAGTTVTADYVKYYNLGSLYTGGAFNEGSTVDNEQIVYMDEENDDLTPDHISILVNTGTANPTEDTYPSIGGIQSEVTDEETAKKDYHYELIDNDFWNVQDPYSGETSFIKAMQSRGIVNSDLAEKSMEANYYIKTATSVTRFSELWPMYAYFASGTKFNKRVMDMWYASQNVGTLTAYNNAIGGYNLFPSFFKRLEDYEDGWIISVSDVDYDNYLLGMEDQKYGIAIDVLGLSTLSTNASGECYNNVMSSVADIAPVYWVLHHEPQPPNYYLFTERWNGFENCLLSNMRYNEDFNIDVHDIDQDASLHTPLLMVATTTATASASGDVELSVLDRVYSENITRKIYYRQGEDLSSMSGWTEVTYPIGEVITLTSTYIQIKLTVVDLLRRIDYEFIGLCFRPYYCSRDWTQRQP